MAGPKEGLLLEQAGGPDNLGEYELVGTTPSHQRTGEKRRSSITGGFGSPLARKASVKKKDRYNETDWQKWGRDKLESNTSQFFTVAIIISNAVCFGLETDEPELFRWDLLEHFFLMFFTFELILRLFSQRAEFFNCMENDDFWWNTFDFLIVFIGVLATILEEILPKTGFFSNDATLFRTVRLLRILRILRVVRVFRFLRQLYLLAYGFMEAGNAVLWVACLAICGIYVCAVILVRVYRGEENEFMRTRFSSIPSTMFTLFEIMAEPNIEHYREAMYGYPVLIGFIVIFIIFGSFGINGLLTGVISDAILEKNNARIESQRIDRENKRRDLMKNASDLFDEMAEECGTEHLTIEEISEYDEKIRLLFQQAGASIPDYHFNQMFEVMDYGGDGTIEKLEFVNAALELCEEIRSMSIMEIRLGVTKCDRNIEDLNETVANCNANVERMMQKLEDLTLDFRSRDSEGAQAKISMAKDEQAVDSAVDCTKMSTENVLVDISKNATAVAAVEVGISPKLEDTTGSGEPKSGVESFTPEPLHSTQMMKIGKPPSDCSDMQLRAASKDIADELLRRVSDIQEQADKLIRGVSEIHGQGDVLLRRVSEIHGQGDVLLSKVSEIQVPKVSEMQVPKACLRKEDTSEVLLGESSCKEGILADAPVSDSVEGISVGIPLEQSREPETSDHAQSMNSENYLGA